MVLEPDVCSNADADGDNVIIPGAIEYEVLVNALAPIFIPEIEVLHATSSVKVISNGASTVAPVAAVKAGEFKAKMLAVNEG